MNSLDPSEEAPTAADVLPVASTPASAAARKRWTPWGAAASNRSAALLLMASSLASAVLGLVRTKYIAYTFPVFQADAYNAAFELPDMINYFLIGGVASIPLITILNRYRHREALPDDDAGADLALSHILNAMLLLLLAATVAAEFLVPLYTRVKFPGFPASKAALCNALTRILLPAQIFFFAGGVLGSRLLVRKIFIYQALTPLIYNLGILVGGLLLARWIGIYSLAVGVLLGVVTAPFALNAVAAARGGMRWQPVLSLRSPAFRDWLRLSLPLMAGVSVVTADKWIQTYFASRAGGAITQLTYAKNLFTAPMGILGQAAGAASLPFFASLWRQGQREGFAQSVNRAVSRVAAASLLLAGAMLALARPAVDLLLRGGSFHRVDAEATAGFFAIFALSLLFWTAQALYARAFYAAGNTLTPAVAGTAVTLASIPLYAVLFRTRGIAGLAAASDAAILLQCAVLAVLLTRRGWVRLSGLEWAELARAAAAAAVGTGAAMAVLRFVPGVGTYHGDVLALAVGGAAWGAGALGVLLLTRSRLPGQLLRRRG